MFKFRSLFQSIAFSLAVAIPVFGQNTVLPYQDASLPVEQQVSDLLWIQEMH